MKILLIGSGGREHAIAWKLSQNPKITKIFCAPGNDGLNDVAQSVAISAVDVPGLLNFAQKEKIDLTLVGTEMPLSHGLVDEFEKAGLRVFGPKKNAAALEYSKCFTKEFATRHRLPTADYEIFQSSEEARAYLKKKNSYPIVLKADGLAFGKGVIIAQNYDEAANAVEQMMIYESFGTAGRKIVIEDFMPGEEATYMVATDGTDYVVLESCQDHKRIFDGDKGPNTGGMGAYSPAPVVSDDIDRKVKAKIIEPLLKGMRDEGRTYKGILYAGLMISDNEPRLVEFNCRFGDPECQAILFRMESDLLELVEAVVDENLSRYKIKFSSDAAVCVVLAAKGYPGEYAKGDTISGLNKVSKMKDVFVFHAGTKKENSHFETNGGRVLGVTARGATLKEAVHRAYEAVGKIEFNGMQYRKDIGAKAL
ncbi:phosphoribosylamine--glycine ligase [bacterium]|nr:phosphoribosylamine--glycine ligase [bacterium]